MLDPVRYIIVRHAIQNRFFFHILLLFLLFIYISSSGQTSSTFNKITWEKLEDLPPGREMAVQPGLASPFAGVSNGSLIVIGGCNFPDTPVYENGKKKYYDDIFVLQHPDSSWKSSTNYPFSVAYGASVTLPEGVLCIGGKNDHAELSEVHLVKWNDELNAIEFERWPDLPFTSSEHTAALSDNFVYVAGGRSNGQLANRFLRLDLNKKGSDDLLWEKLPDFPGPARLQAIAIGQHAAEEAHFYLISGSSYPSESEEPSISTNVLDFNPRTNTWSDLGQIKTEENHLYSLHGGSGIPVGVHHIIFIGGINRQIFHEAWENDRKLQEAVNSNDTVNISTLKKDIKNYFIQSPEFYQFNKDILAYHTITNSWTDIGKYPFPAPAGAPMIKWRDGFAVISGEIKPGVRSPHVYFGNLISAPLFGWFNWTILFIYLSGMVFLGYFFMKRESSTNDFFKGGERIPWWAAGMSIFATMLSAITFMAIPAKTYATNWLYFILAVTILIVAFPVVKYYLPFFRRLNVTTAYEYLEKRFNYAVRLLASLLFILFMIARMALVLFLPSLALTTVTGIDIYLCIALMGIITLAYCTMGGIEAVVWGDVIQGFVLLGGAMLSALFLIGGTEGGLTAVIDITGQYEKMKVFDFTFDLTTATFWVVLLGGLANNLISYSSDQTVIQRYLTTKDEKSAGKSILLNGVLSIFISFIFYFIGTSLFTYFHTNPGELDVTMENPDSIFPYFIMTKMPVGIAGLLISAIFAATMSTVSSNINSMSTAFTSDIYKKVISNKQDSHYLRIARISGIITGGIGIILALLMATWNILSLLDYFNYMLGLMASGLGGLFIMGIFFRRIDGKSALVGFLVGITSLLLISNFTNIHFLLYGFIGIFNSVFIALLLSIIFKPKEKNINGLTYQTLKVNHDE